jgi:hypothetical protein
MMRSGSNNDKKKDDLLETYLRDKARLAALKLIQDVNQKAAKDVDNRLKHLAPEEQTVESIDGNQTKCGRVEDSEGSFSEGLEGLFQKYYRRGMAALNRGDASTATFYLGKCLTVPVSDDIKMRTMVRHNLRLAMSLRDRQKTD